MPPAKVYTPTPSAVGIPYDTYASCFQLGSISCRSVLDSSVTLRTHPPDGYKSYSLSFDFATCDIQPQFPELPSAITCAVQAPEFGYVYQMLL